MLEYHPKMATLYNDMAGLYFSYGNYERSLEYFTNSNEILWNMSDDEIACAFVDKPTNVIALNGPSFEIGLNSRYLLDALKACETEKIKILFIFIHIT